MKNRKNISSKAVALSALFIPLLYCCTQSKESKLSDNQSEHVNNWKAEFERRLPLLGHRNWIIVADKAFPLQNAPGIEYINTEEALPDALDYVVRKIDSSSHISPVLYRDKELSFVSEDQSKGVSAFLKKSQKSMGGNRVHTMLHDSIFVKLDETAKLFKVLVLKTDETIPYSSVMIQLDCGYWNSKNETELRSRMNEI